MSNQHFLCPQCYQAKLIIDSADDIKPDDYNDEARLQTMICENCNFKGIAIYQESTRGSVDETNFIHTGYKVTEELYKQTKKDINNKQIKSMDSYQSHESFKMELVDN